MENPLWDMLPDEVRAKVDGLVVQNRKLHAVKVVREGFSEPRPGLHQCMELVAERYAALGERFTCSPTASLDLDALTADVQALPAPPAAIEAVWDGDSEGWMIDLLAVTSEPNAEYCLASIRHGTDLRLFNRQVPPWPEAEEADTIGRPAAGSQIRRPVPFREP